MKTEHTVRKTLAAAVVVAVCATLQLGFSSTAAETYEALDTPMEQGTCLDCLEGEVCVEGYHLAFDTSYPEFQIWTRNGGAHNDWQCYSGTCATKHGPECDIETATDAEFESLRIALKAHDAPATAELIASKPTRLVINLARSAVQGVGCKGNVVFHLPVSAKFIAAIQSELAKHAGQ